MRIKKRKPWTLKTKLIPAIRRVWLYSSARREALKRQKVKPGYYKCQKCGCVQYIKRVRVDHISPVILPSKGFEGWDKYIRRLFFGKLQVLCVVCHKTKTQKEDKIRRNRRKRS